MVGTRLAALLKEKGHEIRILTRTPKNSNEFAWDIKKKYIDPKALKDATYIIHLAGAGIADKRWSPQRKQEITDSRVQSVTLLLQKVTALNISLKGFISASGIGYYGANTSDVIFKEDSLPANDFIGTVCNEWETAAFAFKKNGIRTVILRTGIVLSKQGGALSKMKTPVISPLGSGNQYMPWIHIDDLCDLYSMAIEDTSFEGVYNAVAPEHQTNKSFSKALAKAFKKPFLPLAIPSFILRVALGKLSIILLKGSRVSTEKILNTTFRFKFSTLEQALKNLAQK